MRCRQQELDADFVKAREQANGILLQARKYVQYVKELRDSLEVHTYPYAMPDPCNSIRHCGLDALQMWVAFFALFDPTTQQPAEGTAALLAVGAAITSEAGAVAGYGADSQANSDEENVTVNIPRPSRRTPAKMLLEHDVCAPRPRGAVL
jgi:hypothetical protein